MKRLAAILASFILLFSTLDAPSRAQNPVYGGIPSPAPVKSTQVLGLELTWLGLRTLSVVIQVRFQMTCDNGQVIAYPNPLANFTAGSTFSIGGFAGTGVFFPCNGWLNWATVLTTSPNNLTPGELMTQLNILNQMPGGWTPATNSAAGSPIQSSVLTGMIENTLISGSIVSGYSASWPSAGGYGSNPILSDPGSDTNINIANPAVATNFQAGSAPLGGANNQVKVINVTYTLTTDANAGNRFACVAFTTGGVNGTVVGGPYCSPYAQQPSQTVIYNFSAGVGWATNCSFLGGTQTAVQCASVEIPLPAYWIANGGLDNFAIDSCVTAGNVAITAGNSAGCSNGFKAADQISSINMRLNVKHAND